MKSTVAVLIFVVCALVGPVLAARIDIAQDRSSALYRNGEDAVFTVSVKDDAGSLVRTDRAKWKLDNFGSFELASGVVDLAKSNPFTVRGTLGEPGFLRLGVSFGTNAAVWSVGYDVEGIRQTEPCPADFDAYWTHEKERLEREVPLDVRCEKDVKWSNERFDAFRVSFSTFGGKRVYGFLAVPVDKSKSPFRVRVMVPGAGPGVIGPWYGDAGEISLTMNVHCFEPASDREGQARLVDSQNAALARKYGLPDPKAYCALAGISFSREEYYYHDVMLGINRAVDWVCARADVDLGQVTYRGSSQGGAFGLFLTYLNRHFTKTFVAVCAMTGHFGSRQGRENGWPDLIAGQPPQGRVVAAGNAAYFDGVNFAARIRSPIRFLVGFADQTCPPANVYAAYNVCPSKDKAIVNAIGAPHGWMPWYRAHCGEAQCPDVDRWLRSCERKLP